MVLGSSLAVTGRQWEEKVSSDSFRIPENIRGRENSVEIETECPRKKPVQKVVGRTQGCRALNVGSTGGDKDSRVA